MEEDLIYDVGMHNGDDAAYYLSKGYRVVAIEADPKLAALAHGRFEGEIERGTLTLLNVAIGPQDGLARFWICDEWSEWNSFDRAIASRQGKKHHAIDVRCRQFRSVLREHGVPYYLKVDIESSDHCCIDGLDHKELPRYVSLEFGRLEDLVALHRLGYNAFKVIHQEASFGHAQFHARQIGRLESFGWKVRGRLGPIKRRIVKLLRMDRWRGNGGTRPPAGSAVAPGPSGPFGEETDGRWNSFEEASYDLCSFALGRSQHGNPPDWNIWFDIHATRRTDVRVTPALYDEPMQKT